MILKGVIGVKSDIHLKNNQAHSAVKQWWGNLLLWGIGGSLLGWLSHSPQWSPIFSQLHISWWGVGIVGMLLLGSSHFSIVWQSPSQISTLPRQQKFLIHFWLALLPVLLFWLLYHRVLVGWWTFDDPHILRYLHTTGPLAGFYDPQKNFAFYTPLLPFSFAVDFWLFGFNPAGFYWHHLLSFSAVILLAYGVLSYFFPPLLASMALNLLVVSTPTAEAVHYIMLRHYIEGLGLALIATWCYISAIKKNQFLVAVVGSLFYFMATTAKEIYVPLGIVLVWLPIGLVKSRLRMLIPFLIAAILYTLLRVYMLGKYTFSSYPEQTTTWQAILNFPVTYFNLMGWQTIWQWLPILLVLLILGRAMVRQPVSLGIPILMWLGAALMPIVPVIWRIPPVYYYLFVPTFLFWIGIVLVFEHFKRLLSSHTWITVWFFWVLLASLLPTQLHQLNLRTARYNMLVQGSFLLYAQLPKTVLIYDYHVADALIYLREHIVNDPGNVEWCRQADCSCILKYKGYTAWQYRHGEWSITTLSPQDCGKASPLAVQVIFTPPNQVTWHLSPYEVNQGQYNIWTDKQGEFHQVPSQGSYSFSQRVVEPIQFIVKYQSAEGWETYSPLLVLNPMELNHQGLVKLEWQRF